MSAERSWRVSRTVIVVVAVAIVAIALIFLFTSLWGPKPPHTTEPPVRAYAGSTGAVAAHSAAPPDDGQWTMAAKNYASTRFAAANEINTGNVGKLQVAFTFSTGIAKGHEAAPLVVGGTMYIVTPFPNIVYALDLTKPGAPAKWSYKPKPLSAAQGVACCDVVNRGAAYADGRIFFNTLDNRTIALDANSGEKIWETQLGSIEQGATMTMAPLVVDGKVLVGNSGGEMGVRGWLVALDAGSGKVPRSLARRIAASLQKARQE